MIIELNETEIKLCEFIAKKRRQENRSRNIIEENRGNYIGIENDIEGIAGELAFCKIFNAYPDTNTVSWADYDLKVFGYTVDVKTTKYKHGKLIAPYWKKNKNHPDYYALMTGKIPLYEFIGFIESKDFINDQHIGDLGYGETYIAEQEELIKTLTPVQGVQGCDEWTSLN